MSTSFQPDSAELSNLEPALRRLALSLAQERRRLEEDEQNLRAQEQNLRAYQDQLRSMQAEIDAHRREGAAATASAAAAIVDGRDEASLQAAWQKVYRARELLEAEHAHLREDRLAIREHALAIARREETVAARERDVAQREALLLAATGGTGTPVPAANAPKPSRNPFGLVRAMLGG
jgi:hypothetical protein